jgi:hypothetical protein
VSEFTRPATWEDVKLLARYFGEAGVEQKRYAIRVNDEITVDVLPSAAGFGWDDLKQHVTQVEIEGVRVRVLDLEGLLKTKQLPRPKDQADAEAIRRALDLLRRKGG